MTLSPVYSVYVCVCSYRGVTLHILFIEIASALAVSTIRLSSGLPFFTVLLSAVSATYAQSLSENINWKTPEVNNW